MRDVFHEARERIAGGLHRPDDFLQRAHGFVRRLDDFFQVRLDLSGVVFVLLGQVAEEGDARERRTEVIMQILRDARPFALERAFLLGVLQPPLIFFLLHHADADRHAGHEREHEQPVEPPRLPESRHDEVVERGRHGQLAEIPPTAAAHVAQADLVERGVRLEPRCQCGWLAFLRRSQREVGAEPHRHQIVAAGDELHLEDDDLVVAATREFVGLHVAFVE